MITGAYEHRSTASVLKSGLTLLAIGRDWDLLQFNTTKSNWQQQQRSAHPPSIMLQQGEHL